MTELRDWIFASRIGIEQLQIDAVSHQQAPTSRGGQVCERQLINRNADIGQSGRFGLQLAQAAHVDAGSGEVVVGAEIDGQIAIDLLPKHHQMR